MSEFKKWLIDRFIIEKRHTAFSLLKPANKKSRLNGEKI